MRRTRLRRALLCVLVLALALGVSGLASAQRVLSMASLAPPGTLIARVLDATNRELRRRTGGQLSMRWYWGGVQGDEAEVVRKVRAGRLDGGALSATGLGQVHRPIVAFQLPAMFQTPDEFVNAYRVLRPELETSFDRAGFSLLYLAPSNGARMFSREAVRAPEDLRRMRPWQWPDDVILPALYQEVGATPVSLAIPEVLGGLQSGRIDVVFGPPLAAVALQWSQHVRFMSERPSSGSLNGLVLSRNAFTSLPTDQQATLRDVIAQTAQMFGRNAQSAEADSIRVLQTQGVQAVQLTEAERSRWLQVFTGMRRRLTGVISDAAWIERVRASGHATPPPAGASAGAPAASAAPSAR